MVTIIGLSVAFVALCGLSITVYVDVTQDWKFISTFFRYRLWSRGTVELVDSLWWKPGRVSPVVRVSDGLSIGKGIHHDSFIFVFHDGEEYNHIQLHWMSSPVSFICLMVMRRVYYPQLEEAHQLLDL